MISVIIPSYNQAEYLPDAIDSVLAQSFSCEIIVVDDGSTDNSLAIAKSYESKGVRVISQVNKGLSSARNTGIMNATGDWIFPLDADDMMKENCLETIQKHIKDDVDIISPSFKCFGLANVEVIIHPGIELHHFKDANRIGYFSAIRKSKLLEIGGYSPKMTWGYEDFHLWINLLSRGAKLVVLKEVLILYRTKENSMITVANAHGQELLAQMQKDFPSLYS